jgi:DNA-binding SARP family transcriptional activator/DNA-binding XRE family transcriptional regulator
MGHSMLEPDTSLPTRIRQLRLSRGLTQAQLASAAGVSLTVVRDLEQGVTQRPRRTSLARLAAALGTSATSPGQVPTDASRPQEPQSRTAASGLRLHVLGPLAAWRGSQPILLGPARQRAVLGALALQPGNLVHRDTIGAMLWPRESPITAIAMIQNAVSHLRQALEVPGRPPVLTTNGSRYQLVANRCELDLVRYRKLTQSAEAARRAGDSLTAWDLYDRALALWTDDPVADIELLQGSPAISALRAQHCGVVADYADDASAKGCHARVLAQLLTLCQREPYDERAHACLMIALAGTGNPAAALTTYDRIRIRLDADLGLAPGPFLTQAQARVLRGAIIHSDAGIRVRATGRQGSAVRLAQRGTLPGLRSPAEGELPESSVG